MKFLIKKKNIIIIILFTLLFALLVLTVQNRYEINNLKLWPFAIEGEEISILSYEITSIGDESSKVLIKIESEDKIKTLETPNNTINVNGKNKIAIDYEIKYGIEYNFKTTKINGEVINKIVKINEKPRLDSATIEQNSATGIKVTVIAPGLETTKLTYKIYEEEKELEAKRLTDIKGFTQYFTKLTQGKKYIVKVSSNLLNEEIKSNELELAFKLNATILKPDGTPLEAYEAYKYYGHRVQYTAVDPYTDKATSIVYRLFYVDSEEYFKENEDNPGTVYLKQDYDGIPAGLSTIEGSEETSKWLQFNSMIETDGYYINNYWRDTWTASRIKALIWMLDPEIWKGYMDTNDGSGLAKYAVGGVSIDMLQRSLKQKYPDININYTYRTQTVNPYLGAFDYCTNNGGWAYGPYYRNVIEMYTSGSSSDRVWIASHLSTGGNSENEYREMFAVLYNSGIHGIRYDNSTTAGFATMICVNPGATLQLLDENDYMLDENKNVLNSSTAEYYIGSVTRDMGEYPSQGTAYKILDGLIDYDYYGPWGSFNNGVWGPSNNVSDHYVWFRLLEPKKITSFTLQNAKAEQYAIWAINDFILQGSNDGENWTDIGNFTNTSDESEYIENFTVNYNYVGNGFEYYRIFATPVHNVNYHIGEMTFKFAE